MNAEAIESMVRDVLSKMNSLQDTASPLSGRPHPPGHAWQKWAIIPWPINTLNG